METKSCCCTGHRPKGFPWDYYGNSEKSKAYRRLLRQKIETLILKKNVTTFYSGMALGADLDFAHIVYELREIKYPFIRLICVLPCRNQDKYYDENAKRAYKILLEDADETIVLHERYFRGCMHHRNRYMVDHADIVLAVWSGYPNRRSGTDYTMAYADSLNKEMHTLLLSEL